MELPVDQRGSDGDGQRLLNASNDYVELDFNDRHSRAVSRTSQQNGSAVLKNSSKLIREERPKCEQSERNQRRSQMQERDSLESPKIVEEKREEVGIGSGHDQPQALVIEEEKMVRDGSSSEQMTIKRESVKAEPCHQVDLLVQNKITLSKRESAAVPDL